MPFSVCSVPFAVSSVLFSVRSVQCAVYNLPCAVFLNCSVVPNDYSLAVVSSVQGQVGVSFEVPSLRSKLGCLLIVSPMQCVMCSVHYTVQKF